MKKRDKRQLLEIVKRMRLNLMIHSFLYYRMNESIISDDKWQEIANNLKAFQDEMGWKWGYYDKEFEDWTGETGFHLPQNGKIQRQALAVLASHERHIKSQGI